jgi:diguanylate cyclase (GGDEF)-like protein
MRIYRLLTSLETLRKGWLISIAVGVVLILGVIDYYTGFELSVSFFYLMPITMVAWGMGRDAGLIFSGISAAIWFTSNFLSGQEITNMFIGVWNTLIRFGFYAVVTVLLAELRHALEGERLLANTDPLTGALNRRSFNEVAEKKMIISEVNRRPYTMMYIDLDDFKAINDKQGHAFGDLVLKTVVDTLQAQIRTTDYLARLGGDEFAILLTDIDQNHAKPIAHRLHTSLLEKMAANGWDITFSIGVLTVLSLPESVDKLVSLADGLMYKVKGEGKNAIQYSTYE